MGKKMTKTEKAAEAAEQSVSEQASEGIRARRAFMTKFLLPNPDWINKEIVAHGKGTQKIVGRLVGFITGAEEQTNEFQGKLLRSVVVYGQFEYESTVTGEIGASSSAFLPTSYSDAVLAQFKADPNLRAVEVDMDLGIEATGKPIPYEWLVIDHMGGDAVMMKRLRNRRRPGQRALAAPSAETAPALAAPAPAADAPTEPEAAEPVQENASKKKK